MKIIDLLNKIAKGEEVPKKFRYNNHTFVYDKEDKDYVYSNGNISFFTDYFTDIYHLEDVLMILNDEVEIIEEEKEIEFEDIEPLVLKTFRRTGEAVTIDRFEEYSFDNFILIEDTLAKVILNQKKIIDVINDMRDKE